MFLISLGIAVVIVAIMFVLFKLDVLNMAYVLEKLRGFLPGV
jgi:hypothetical protein